MSVADTMTADPVSRPHTDSVAAFVPDQSRAERTASFDVSAFPVPTGREEEWRFTPVKKLSALFAEGASDGLAWTDSLPAGVTVSPISASRIVAMSFCEPRSCRLQLSS